MGFWHNGGFFSSVKGHVIKWWQQIILPVLHINLEQRRASGKIQADQQLLHQEETVKESSKPVLTENETIGITEGQMDDVELARQRAEQVRREEELRRQKELEKLKNEAQEQARINSIMNANKVNINAFIKEGEENRNAEEEERRRQDEERRAQEIIDRLNREAAEDEAKKQAEIEAARQEAKEKFD